MKKIIRIAVPAFLCAGLAFSSTVSAEKLNKASAETSSAIDDYELPKELGDDLSVYRISSGDVIYELPVPVSVFTDNGWTMEEDSDQKVDADSTGWIYLSKGDQELSLNVVNQEDQEADVSDCWIEQLCVSGEGAIPCGITIGMTEDDLLKILNTII